MAKVKKIGSVAKPAARIASKMKKSGVNKPGTLADTLRRTKSDMQTMSMMHSAGRKK